MLKYFIVQVLFEKILFTKMSFLFLMTCCNKFSAKYCKLSNAKFYSRLSIKGFVPSNHYHNVIFSMLRYICAMKQFLQHTTTQPKFLNRLSIAVNLISYSATINSSAHCQTLYCQNEHHFNTSVTSHSNFCHISQKYLLK